MSSLKRSGVRCCAENAARCCGEVLRRGSAPKNAAKSCAQTSPERRGVRCCAENAATCCGEALRWKCGEVLRRKCGEQVCGPGRVLLTTREREKGRRPPLPLYNK